MWILHRNNDSLTTKYHDVLAVHDVNLDFFISLLLDPSASFQYPENWDIISFLDSFDYDLPSFPDLDIAASEPSGLPDAAERKASEADTGSSEKLYTISYSDIAQTSEENPAHAVLEPTVLTTGGNVLKTKLRLQLGFNYSHRLAL